MTRALVVGAAFAAAALLIALAIDAGRWEHASSRPPATLLGGAAEYVLGTSNDVALGNAVRSFLRAERTPYGFDNGLRRSQVRAEAESTLATVGSRSGSRQASQADDLLGVLAWGATQAPAGVLDPADQAVQAFTNAARLNPQNVDAAFNLELALRALQASGARSGTNAGNSPNGFGRSGASAGTAGEGY